MLPKFQVYWESKSLGSQHSFYYCQPLAWHCLLLIAWPQSLSAQTSYQPIASTLKLRLILQLKITYLGNGGPPPYQRGRRRRFATVCKTTILPSIHIVREFLSAYHR